VGGESGAGSDGSRAGGAPSAPRSAASGVPGGGGRTARSTKRPAKKLPNGLGIAKRLAQPELRARLQLTEAEAKFLDRCTSGRAPRNAATGLSALKLRLDFAYEKPKQDVNLSGSATFTLVDPFARKPGDG